MGVEGIIRPELFLWIHLHRHAPLISLCPSLALIVKLDQHFGFFKCFK